MKVRFGSRVIHDKQFNAYVVSSVKALRSIGIVPGDRVALYDSNTTEYAIVIICLWRLGAVACPINPKWPIQEARAYAHRISAKFFFSRDDIKKMVAFDARQQLYAPVDLGPFDPQQDAVIIATSGTNGVPKPALLTIGNLLANAHGSASQIPFTAEDGWLLSLPLFHISGISILMRCLVADSTLIVALADDLIDDIKRSGVTHVSLVATQFYRLMQNPEGVSALKSLKAILLGGSAISPALLKLSVDFNLPVYVSYGLTEMASQVATGRLSSTGALRVVVLPMRALMIGDNDEILVKGEVLFKGYVMGNRVHLPVDKQGWFHTGDRGIFNEQDGLRVLGRIDNMFICAGENIHPEMIEKVILEIPGVKQVIVVAQHNQEYGSKPVAFIDKSEAVDHQAIIDFCKQRLPGIMVPTQLFEFPAKFSGIKPNRKELAQFANEQIN